VALNGGYKIYPESAAMGLWSNPIDISKWLINIQNTLAGQKHSPILDSKLIKEMITPVNGPYGLGPVINGTDDNLEISHKGRSGGFTCGFVAYPFLKKGIVVMMNSDSSGFSLVDEITRAVSDFYQWPFNKTKMKTKIMPSLIDLDKCPGRYAINGIENDLYDSFVSSQNGELFIHSGIASTPSKFYKEAENKFFSETGEDYLFSEEMNGEQMTMKLKIITQSGQEFSQDKL
jgi:hypothetical protein